MTWIEYLFRHKLLNKVILVLNTKGGVATAWMLYEMSSRKIAPKALILNSINTILAQGAALAKMAIVDRFEEGDVTKLIKTGDELTVQPSLGRVVLINSL